MKVRQFIGRNGPVKNQFVIYGDDGSQTFQSYETAIARINSDGSVVLASGAWDYSRTTGKYRNQFLNEGKAETLKKIKSGEYKLEDLNR